MQKWWPFVGLALATACVASCSSTATRTPTPSPSAVPSPSPVTATPLPVTPSPTGIEPGATPSITALPTVAHAMATLREEALGISVEYPPDWQPVPGYQWRWGGEGGFFQLAAIEGGGATLDQVADGEAHHKLQPYGSAPTIEVLMVEGSPARLIRPSEDQPAAMEGQAALIIDAPWEIDISGNSYGFLILWADAGHIESIVDTLQLARPIGLSPQGETPQPTELPTCVPLQSQEVCWLAVPEWGVQGPDSPAAAGYLVYLPQGYGEDVERRWPLLLFLHGSEERGSEPTALTRQGIPRLLDQGLELPFIVVSPQCPADRRWWQVTRWLALFLDEVEGSYAVDSRHVYLTGLSMGGYGAWALAYQYPERFAAVAPIAGGYYDGTGVLPRDLCRMAGVPIWAFHGAQDVLVPLSESEQVVSALQACGSSVRLTIYPEIGHYESWERAYAEPALFEWFLAHELP